MYLSFMTLVRVHIGSCNYFPVHIQGRILDFGKGGGSILGLQAKKNIFDNRANIRTLLVVTNITMLIHMYVHIFLYGRKIAVRGYKI